MGPGALIINARVGLTDEELVERIKKNPDLQFGIGLESFQVSAAFDPSMMVYLPQRLPSAMVNVCTERIVRHGLNVIRSSDPKGSDHTHSSGGRTASAGVQQKPSAKKPPNQGPRWVDAICVPMASLHPIATWPSPAGYGEP